MCIADFCRPGVDCLNAFNVSANRHSSAAYRSDEVSKAPFIDTIVRGRFCGHPLIPQACQAMHGNCHVSGLVWARPRAELRARWVLVGLWRTKTKVIGWNDVHRRLVAALVISHRAVNRRLTLRRVRQNQSHFTSDKTAVISQTLNFTCTQAVAEAFKQIIADHSSCWLPALADAGECGRYKMKISVSQVEK